VQFDKFTTELTLMPRDIVPIQPVMKMTMRRKKEWKLHSPYQDVGDGWVVFVQSLIKKGCGMGDIEAVAVTITGSFKLFPMPSMPAKSRDQSHPWNGRVSGR
jgi:DNA polymerase-3 subunit alpha (Gram-positive type)